MGVLFYQKTESGPNPCALTTRLPLAVKSTNSGARCACRAVRAPRLSPELLHLLGGEVSVPPQGRENVLGAGPSEGLPPGRVGKPVSMWHELRGTPGVKKVLLRHLMTLQELQGERGDREEAEKKM